MEQLSTTSRDQSIWSPRAIQSSSASGSDPTRPPVANRAGGASTSSRPAPEFLQEHLPGNAAAKDEDNTRGTRDPRRAVAHRVAVVRESARTARQDPTTNRRAARRPCLFTLPRRRRSSFGRFCYTL